MSSDKILLTNNKIKYKSHFLNIATDSRVRLYKVINRCFHSWSESRMTLRQVLVLQGGGALWCVRCLSVAGCGRNSLVESQAQVCHLSALMGRLSIQLRGHTRILTPPRQCLTHTHTHAQGKVQVCDSNVTVIFPV